MRDVVLALGLATVWLVGTPIVDARHRSRRPLCRHPDWLAIPLNADTTEVRRSRLQAAGHLNAVSDLPAAAVVEIMKTRLALQGFEIHRQVRRSDRIGRSGNRLSGRQSHRWPSRHGRGGGHADGRRVAIDLLRAGRRVRLSSL